MCATSRKLNTLAGPLLATGLTCHCVCHTCTPTFHQYTHTCLASSGVHLVQDGRVKGKAHELQSQAAGKMAKLNPYKDIAGSNIMKLVSCHLQTATSDSVAPIIRYWLSLSEWLNSNIKESLFASCNQISISIVSIHYSVSVLRISAKSSAQHPRPILCKYKEKTEEIGFALLFSVEVMVNGLPSLQG